MTTIPRSGFFYPNKAGYIFLHALEDVMGKNGVSAVLNYARLESWVDHYPPNNLERQFDFAQMSAINGALEEMYGPRGGGNLARRAGWVTFDELLRNFGALVGVGDFAFKVLPLQTKLKIGLQALARVIAQISDQESSLEETKDSFIFNIHRCPICWGRRSKMPACHAAVGLLEQNLRWVSGQHNFKIVETECIAMGHEACRFDIERIPID
ncbi:MAG: 4-vinyl reductase [Anaerolineales bacterium]